MQHHRIPISQNQCVLVIESDFAVHGIWSDVEINKIRDNKIPKHASVQNPQEILIENMKKMDTEQ